MKKWDPNCPKCREELERHAELWQAQYDDVDHGAGIYRLLFEHYCTHESRESGREEDRVMEENHGPKYVPNYTQPLHIAPEIGTKPPVGAWIAKDPVCRDCMTSVEEISMRRGFVDPISAEETGRKEHVCTRCDKKIPAGPQTVEPAR